MKIFAIVAALMAPCLAVAQSAKAKDSGSRYQFFEFSSTTKNMWQYGVLLDGLTGKAWLIESKTDSGGDKSTSAPYATPVIFETGKIENYTPAQAAFSLEQEIKRQIEQQKKEHEKENQQLQENIKAGAAQ